MRIAIIGAGSMGAVFGAFLSIGGHDVIFVEVRPEQVEMLNARGLCIETASGTMTVPVRAVASLQAVDDPEIVLFFVKSYDTQTAAAAWKAVDNGTATLITLQNGLGNAEVLADFFGPERVLAGTTSMGAASVGVGRVQLNHRGRVQLGAVDQAGEGRLQQIGSVFNACGIETVLEEEVQQILWAKLFVNVGINAISALTGRKNGQLLNDEDTESLMRQAVTEAVVVAQAQGFQVDEALVWLQVRQIARDTGNNRSSMLQDILRGGRTEIDVINGAVVRVGQQLGIVTPVNESLTRLVRALERKHKYN